MGQYGMVLAAIAAAFTATDCLAEGIRRAPPPPHSSGCRARCCLWPT